MLLLTPKLFSLLTGLREARRMMTVEQIHSVTMHYLPRRTSLPTPFLARQTNRGTSQFLCHCGSLKPLKWVGKDLRRGSR